MCISNIIVIVALIVCTDGRHLPAKERKPYLIVEDSENISTYVLVEPETSEDNNVSRVRRQVPDNIYTNPERRYDNGISRFGDVKNKLSANGGISEEDNRGYRDASIGLALNKIIDRATTLTRNFIPNLANQLTAAGKANLFHYDKHDVTAQAFATRNFPNKPNIPNFNTFGGKLGYTYDKKLGATLGMAHTDLFKKTDYSAMGNMKLLGDDDHTLNLKAGFGKSVSPYLSSSTWKPSVGLSFTKVFDFLKTIF